MCLIISILIMAWSGWTIMTYNYAIYDVNIISCKSSLGVMNFVAFLKIFNVNYPFCFCFGFIGYTFFYYKIDIEIT